MNYPSEKFSEARRNLMLPHPQGEHVSIADAFVECDAGLAHLDEIILDDNAKGWIKELKTMMDYKEVTDRNGEGLYTAKAKTFSDDEKIRLSFIINELADWFELYDRKDF